MASYGQVALGVALNKELHPERYCPAHGCLWKTAEPAPDGKRYVLNADPCHKHPSLNTAPAVLESLETALVPYNPRFKFGWAYVADCAEEALMIRVKELDRQFQATMQEVRKANRMLAI